MSTKPTVRAHKTIQLPYHTVRHISCQDDFESGRKVYVGYAPVAAIVNLPTDENVRDYLLEAEGRKRRRPTQVHRAIQDTLKNNPKDFSVLNSGVVIVAHYCDIDEKNKILSLKDPSIVNGSQTQGVIRDFLQDLEKDNDNYREFTAHIKFEVIVTNDEALIAEVSIARNFQNDVMTISIAGRLGQLDELEQSLQLERPEARLQKSETKLSDDYIKTERLLQVITALIPEELWPKNKEFNKVYAYSMKAKCLKEFQMLYENVKNKNSADKSSSDLYQFYLDIAAQALELYDKWKSHPRFKGTGIRSIERDASNKIEDVPDGIIFPILAALSAFARRTKTGWIIDPPQLFTDDELIRAAKSVYMDIANHNPWNMGKSKSCYAALYQITSIFRRLSN